MPPVYIGVDVAKRWIDVFDPQEGHVRVPTAELARFARQLPEGVLVVFEASGGYERALVAALQKAGVPSARVNPRQAREYARATGRLAKTDRVDACMLAEMGSALGLEATPSLGKAARRLAALVARRDDLVAMRVQEKNRLAQAHDPAVKADIRSMIALLDRRVAKADTAIADQIATDDALAARAERLRTAPGIGPVTAAVLTARLPELGHVDRRAIASLAGLAPHACDSGQMRGKRMIWGGRADVRRALYLAAFAASRCDPDLKAFRTRLTDAGKPHKLALIACARRLLERLNAIIRDDRDYRRSAPA